MQSKIDRRFRTYYNKQSVIAQDAVKYRSYANVIRKMDHKRLKLNVNVSTAPSFESDIMKYLPKLSRLATRLYRNNVVSLRFNRNPP